MRACDHIDTLFLLPFYLRHMAKCIFVVTKNRNSDFLFVLLFSLSSSSLHSFGCAGSIVSIHRRNEEQAFVLGLVLSVEFVLVWSLFLNGQIIWINNYLTEFKMEKVIKNSSGTHRGQCLMNT